mmetsp:Transcript_51826/g.152743  ORF Transcript_51826/g.152743 Transcript_51826/m.152743 type:complete len:246 (-) Transcript_51826:188-925(-)
MLRPPAPGPQGSEASLQGRLPGDRERLPAAPGRVHEGLLQPEGLPEALVAARHRDFALHLRERDYQLRSGVPRQQWQRGAPARGLREGGDLQAPGPAPGLVQAEAGDGGAPQPGDRPGRVQERGVQDAARVPEGLRVQDQDLQARRREKAGRGLHGRNPLGAGGPADGQHGRGGGREHEAVCDPLRGERRDDAHGAPLPRWVDRRWARLPAGQEACRCPADGGVRHGGSAQPHVGRQAVRRRARA